MILVTTAGKVGAETARLLAGQREPVRILVRDPVKAEPLAQAGAEVVVGDLGVPATVDAAMKGVSAVVLVSPAIPAEELNVIAGAVRAGVGHVVKITSKSSIDSPIARRRDQAEIENGLIAGGLGYTLLKNNAYMQNFLMSAPAIAGTSSFGSAAGDGRIGMIDTRDVAAVAAAIASSPADHVGKTYWPTGPESLSYPDAAAVFSTVLGRPITFHPLTYSEQKQAMVEAGVPEHIAEMNTQAITLFAEGDSDWVTGDVPSILGRPARTFAQFVHDNAAAFSASRR
ncbi:NmrA family NAD(P)-binding protein [Amycolatopsis sp. NBC_01480]|uniref:NmrA family NAD(P)-binding protein n=1 Tax=Amycolatopsis sp. NBC_01480 TaxID=2903562 RepID=UPI002E2E5D6C|nr:NmrA family NAD(P)-binding protein [Amycolatopsis sp. NBC_01480]